MPATFDGVKLLVTLPPGVTTIDIKIDLYSDWKEWQLLGDNMKYPHLFRSSVGGDSLLPGLDSGAYFFFQNQLGWRLRPPEENINITVTGNLIAEDPALPIFIPTLGGFTAFINGLQPITQSVDKLISGQLAESYAAPGVKPTLPQILYMIWSILNNFGISGTVNTTKKLDGTTAMTFALDDGNNPSSLTRAT